jgi:hypothetical protein
MRNLFCALGDVIFLDTGYTRTDGAEELGVPHCAVWYGLVRLADTS